MRLVLASRSPRRAQLLETAGILFRVQPAPDVEEVLAARLQAERVHPARYTELLAHAKAKEVAELCPGELVLGADTIVLLDGDVLEKPRDRADAVRLLTRLSGRTHTVISAIALVGGPAGGGLAVHERTEVDFIHLDRAWIEAYVATGEPMDKAGAYGIQGYGALMVAGVRGCYFNVMGLPLARLGALLRTVLAPEEPA
ncbi:MAG: septum formation protein Maf [Krumholzibacteria bacterium]|nr:septum formation protein Maf [Candidatus Krumholzibacteria bacterium]